jgi:hypothetical protein
MGDRWIGKNVKRSCSHLILRYYLRIFLEGLRKTTKNSVRIGGFWPEIWAEDFPNTKQEFQTINHVFRFESSLSQKGRRNITHGAELYVLNSYPHKVQCVPTAKLLWSSSFFYDVMLSRWLPLLKSSQDCHFLTNYQCFRDQLCLITRAMITAQSLDLLCSVQ